MSRLWRGWFESSYSALVGKCCWRDPASPDNNYEFRLSGRCGRDMLDASSFYSGALPTSASAPLDGSNIQLGHLRVSGDDRNAGSTARSRRRRHHAHWRQGEQGQGTPAPAKKNTTRPIDNLHRNWKAKRAMVALTQGGRAWRPWGGVTASCAVPTVGQSQIGDILLVTVRDNNIDQALKFLKKKMQREGIFREMKLRSAYEKPSTPGRAIFSNEGKTEPRLVLP
jgi:ribosomal protein S21